MALKFGQVTCMFNSLIFTYFEVIFGILSALVTQINVLESFLDIYDKKNVKIMIIYALKLKFYKYFIFTKNTPMICLILHLFFMFIVEKLFKELAEKPLTNDFFLAKIVA